MKILKLRFKNLNSLHGEWEIDFSAPEYRADGLFAITGPTGSGKSTILDAICLALYGMTPRLGKITVSNNEIMSRRTGECFSEVTFETSEGRYRCHWSQHKARRKPDGKLAQAKHEISDADSGKILEEKIRNVADVIIQKTGMDYERFTRSILLAQGSFDTFLKADPGQRAPILEQITGTEVYSDISIKVHERQRQENEILSNLQAEADGMLLLNEEELSELGTEVEEKKGLEQKLIKDIDRFRIARQWFDDIARLEKEAVEVGKLAEAAVLEQENAEPKKQRLKTAKAAKELEADYSILQLQRKTQQSNQRILQELQADSPQSKENLSNAEARLAEHRVYREQLEQEWEKEQKVISQVRELDIILGTEDEKTANLLSDVEEIANAMLSLEKTITDQKVLQTALTEEISAAVHFVNEHYGDGGWSEVEASILDEESTKVEESTLTEEDAKTEEKADGTGAKEQFDESKSIWDFVDRLLSEYSGLKARIESHIHSTTAIMELSKRKISVEGKLATAKSLVNRINIKIDEAHVESQEIQKISAAAEKRLQQFLDGRMLREYRAERDHLLRERAYIKKITDLESERENLEDGIPCPLCGSTEHPFAAGNIPQISEIDSNLETLNQKIDKTEELEETYQKTKIDVQKMKEARHTIDMELQTALHEKKAADSELTTVKIALEEELKKHAIETKRIQVGLTPYKLTLPELLTTLEKSRMGTEIIQGTEVIQKLDPDSTGVSQDSTGVSQGENELMKELVRELEARNSSLKEVVTKRETAERTIIKTKTELARHIEDMAALKKQLAKIGPELEEQKKKAALIHDKRDNMYGDKIPDAEEKIWKQKLRSAETAVNEASESYNTFREEYLALSMRITRTEEEIEAAAPQLEREESDFSIKRGVLGFDDEQTYRNSRLQSEDLASLDESLRSIEKEVTETKRLKIDLEQKLRIEREKEVTHEMPKTVRSKLLQAETQLKQAIEEIGGLNQRLDADRQAKIAVGQMTDKIENQRKECEKWNRLHGLIGSADGKKYCNFAQGLTFQVLVGHANRQLQTMTDRYLLIHDDQKPLELNVIDNYQAGEIRSTKNLSGGESFIVSLALALGLSGMASRKVRVDSLFLDEGFGTLDEDALETALIALGNLHQDEKLIGIISHISALKERIGTRISVLPGRAGRSTLEGPGCGRSNDHLTV